MSTLEDRIRSHEREEIVERNKHEAMRSRTVEANYREARREAFADTVAGFASFVDRPFGRALVQLSRLGVILGAVGVATIALYASMI